MLRGSVDMTEQLNSVGLIVVSEINRCECEGPLQGVHPRVVSSRQTFASTDPNWRTRGLLDDSYRCELSKL